ncbi:MAG: DEAD/DEAH box helicase family protein [Bacteroidales bacterium]|nr:DEAD/DEAH box helicase family protein [Bacteroidales bacterium]
MPDNQFPEQKARDQIDALLVQTGWTIQNKDEINFADGLGIAVRGYQTEVGPTDYILFVDRYPMGVIEAKKESEGQRLIYHEDQAEEYARSKLKYFNNEPLSFAYESTGTITRFTDLKDPKPRSREVFTFHRPETLKEWHAQAKSLRERLHDLPVLTPEGLRECQFKGINNLEKSFRDNRPRALIQMATGSGKTYTAITSIYRLLKYCDATRILFLVDTRNLGEQAEQEFQRFIPNDDNRKFTELYNVQRLNSKYISPTNQVCISTIQRLYSILKGEELEDTAEDINPYDAYQPKEPVPVVYNPKVPVEFFDFIVIDECHRSIYNLWKQVLDYFDAFLIGLTATPDKRTFGFFNENVVSEYSHEEAVADGVNVGYEVYLIETEITIEGAKIQAKEYVDKRNRLTRQKRWEQLDEDLEYTAKQLDKDVVNFSVMRNIIRAFKEKLPEIFPGRSEVPKTLIFAKDDSHANDIIHVVREEFAEGNDFCKKVTYKTEEDPKSILANFRNAYYPRIAVTVDMIATGTDVKPLECLIFMRDVRSRNYFEQMKGRGTRTFDMDDLKKVTPSASTAKTHFVVIDTVGVTKSIKTESRPLERKKSVPLKELLNAVMLGARDEDTFISVAGRLARLSNQMTAEDKNLFSELSGGKPINIVIHDLLNAHNPDKIETTAREQYQVEAGKAPSSDQLELVQETLIKTAKSHFNGKLNEFVVKVQQIIDQVIDTVNIDKVKYAGWDEHSAETSTQIIKDFKSFLEENKDEVVALSIFYDQPYRRKELTYKMIREVLDILRLQRPALAPVRVWEAYERIEQVNGKSPKNELIALVSLIRKVSGIDQVLTPYDQTVNRNFQTWVFGKQAGPIKFNEEQMEWLRMIKEHIANSIHVDKEDLDFAPFDAKGGIGGMYQLFGQEMEKIIEEINEALVA